jgi:hypothetical protein
MSAVGPQEFCWATKIFILGSSWTAVVSSTPRLSGFQTHKLVVIGFDYIGSYKSNYYTITTTAAPSFDPDQHHPYPQLKKGILSIIK